ADRLDFAPEVRRRVREKRPQLPNRHLLRLAPGFVDYLEDSGDAFLIESRSAQVIRPKVAVAQPHVKIRRGQPKRGQGLNQESDQFDLRLRAGLAQNIGIKLIKRPQPAALLPLVTVLLADRKPFDRPLQRVGPGANHARETRRHLRTQRHLTAAAVLKGKELLHDLVAGFDPEQLQRLQNRSVVLRKSEPVRGQSPRSEQMVAAGAFVWIKLPKPG